jgi:hypothetical protein
LHWFGWNTRCVWGMSLPLSSPTYSMYNKPAAFFWLTDVTSGGGVLFGTEVQLKQGTLFLKIRDRELGCSLEIYVPVDTCVRDQQVHREARLNSSTQGVSNHVVVVVGGGG